MADQVCCLRVGLGQLELQRLWGTKICCFNMRKTNHPEPYASMADATLAAGCFELSKTSL